MTIQFLLCFILFFASAIGFSENRPVSTLIANRSCNLYHDFKLSVCEIEYSEARQLFEVKFYLFQDDLKAVLYGNPNAEKIDVENAKKYILEHFGIKTDNRSQMLDFQSFREKNDQVLVTFSMPKMALKNISKMQVKNTLLIEKFRQQVNMVYAILPGHSKMTQMLNATKTEGEFLF